MSVRDSRITLKRPVKWREEIQETNKQEEKSKIWALGMGKGHLSGQGEQVSREETAVGRACAEALGQNHVRY